MPDLNQMIIKMFIHPRQDTLVFSMISRYEDCLQDTDASRDLSQIQEVYNWINGKYKVQTPKNKEQERRLQLHRPQFSSYFIT